MVQAAGFEALGSDLARGPRSGTGAAMSTAGFELGTIVATPGALQDFGPALIAELLSRHAGGDWGDLDAHDRRENECGVREGSRIFSAYDTPRGRAWVITESDRSSTCVLRPEDY
jgi:hypothetical protein